jgi:S-adenosylmethionine/arginine decarboxylase-like enzyme
MFDCKNCVKELIRDGENIRKFVEELVPAIDMKAYGDPMVVHFATHADDKAGYSLCQMIETSNITGHFVDMNGDAYLDIFSCKPVDIGTAESVIRKYFKPERMKVNFLTRHAE